VAKDASQMAPYSLNSVHTSFDQGPTIQGIQFHLGRTPRGKKVSQSKFSKKWNCGVNTAGGHAHVMILYESLSFYLKNKLVERMPRVYKAVIKAKVCYVKVGYKIHLMNKWLLHDSKSYFIVLMSSLLFYNVNSKSKEKPWNE
jgi:hypothetical protein